jgi:vacuolar protein sorting-associated protein 13A/C
MKLKASLFNSMPVPFQLIYGQVGLIHLKIPVWNMFKSPLVIEIENVFGIIRPKRIDEWSEEVEVKNFKSNTQAVLDRFEVFQ